MLIDWFTVGAQAVNFLILVYLLKRFLYGPIIKAMEEREGKIARRMSEAQKNREAAEQEKALFEEKNRGLEKQRDALLTQMKEEVENARHALMHDVRTQVEGMQEKWYGAMEQEKAAFLQDLRYRAGEHTYRVARQALHDLGKVELEIHIARVFEEKLQHLEEREVEKLKKALQASGGKALLQSAFPLPEDAVHGISKALEAINGHPVDVTLERVSDILCGVEMTAHGHKVAWSIKKYLEDLEGHLSQAFEAVALKPLTGEQINGSSTGGTEASPQAHS